MRFNKLKFSTLFAFVTLSLSASFVGDDRPDSDLNEAFSKVDMNAVATDLIANSMTVNFFVIFRFQYFSIPFHLPGDFLLTQFYF
jgi:hypothetical protein